MSDAEAIDKADLDQRERIKDAFKAVVSALEALPIREQGRVVRAVSVILFGVDLYDLDFD